MNRIEVEKELRALGAAVETVHRTGEMRYSHPRMTRPVVVNGRRKDATKTAEAFLRQLRKLLAASELEDAT